MRASRIGIVTLAMALVLFAAACGSSGGSDSSSSSGSKTSDTSKSGGGDSGGGGSTTSGLKDPCTLVSKAKASEILGGPSAEPKSKTSDVGAPARICTWQTQESIDNPSLDTVGHILTLTVFGPPSESMTTEQFFDQARLGASAKANVCEKSFYQGGILNGFQNDTFVSGSAGLADTSAKAKKAVTDLVSAACDTLG